MIDVCIYVLTSVFRAIVNIQFIGVFFKSNHKPNIKNLFLVLGFVIFSSISLFFFDTIITFFITNTIFIFVISFFNTGNLQRKLIAITALFMFTILCDSLFYTGLKFILNREVPHYVLNICISAAIFIVANLYNGNFHSYHLEELSFNKFIIVAGAPASSITIFILTYYSNPSDIVGLFITLSLILLNLFIFYSYDIIIKSKNIEYENNILGLANEAYKTQMDIISKARDETLTLKHDINNHILSMRHLIKSREYEKLENHLLSMSNEIKEEYIYSKSGNLIIDSILNYKFSLIKSLDANIHCEINLPREDFMSLFDLTIILGNLLDNVYEALINVQNKEFYIDILYDKGVLFINSKNTFSNSLIKTNGNLMTTKKNKKNHGFGIRNIKKVVDKYNGEFKASNTGSFFVYEIILFAK